MLFSILLAYLAVALFALFQSWGQSFSLGFGTGRQRHTKAHGSTPPRPQHKPPTERPRAHHSTPNGNTLFFLVLSSFPKPGGKSRGLWGRGNASPAPRQSLSHARNFGKEFNKTLLLSCSAVLVNRPKQCYKRFWRRSRLTTGTSRAYPSSTYMAAESGGFPYVLWGPARFDHPRQASCGRANECHVPFTPRQVPVPLDTSPVFILSVFAVFLL